MEKTHYIYRITHLPSGRFYIGKRSCNGPWQEDRYMGSGTYLKRLLKKYPAEEFKKEVLCLCRDAAQALYAERAAIGTQWRDNPLCINLREGGEGVVAFWDLPENRDAQSERLKKRWEDPAQREALSELCRKRWEDPAQRAAASEASKKAWQDPALREKQSVIQADRANKHWADPVNREAAAERMKQRYEDPEQRASQSERMKKRFEDPEQREAMSASQISDTVRLSKNGVIYKVNKELLLSELEAGADLAGTMTHIHHPTEGVWITCRVKPAKHLLLLNVGWEFGQRLLLEKITVSTHVDKTTGKVLPRS